MCAEHLTYTLEELRGEAFPVIRYQFFGWSIIEDPGIDKGLGDFGGGDSFHWDCLNELGKSIDDDQEVLLSSGRPNEFPQDVDAYRLLSLIHI